MVKANKHMKTITKSARLSMKTKTNTLLGAVLFLLVICAAAPGGHAQSDTFDGNVLDTERWVIAEPLGPSAVTQNDALYLASDNTPGDFCFTPGNFGRGAGIAQRRKLEGDFDIQVDFSDFDGPFEDLVQAWLQIYQDGAPGYYENGAPIFPGNQLHIKRMRASYGDFLQTVASVNGAFPIQSGLTPSSASSGTFRIVRVGSHITTYFNGVEDFSIGAFSGPVVLLIAIGGPIGSSIVFDNFQINSGTLVDPPLSCGGPCVPLPSGAVAWWRAEGNALDSVGSHHGELQGGIAFAASRVGQAFSLDGFDDSVIIPHSEDLNPTGPFSVECWIQAAADQHSPDGYFLVVDKSHGFIDYTGWVMQGNPDGTVGFGFGVGFGWAPGATTLTSVRDNQWHHLAGVFTGSAVELYLDGVLQGSLPESSLPAGNTRPVEIGQAWGGGFPRRFFHGLIDEVSYYNRALTAGEVQSIYAAGSAGKCDNQPPVAIDDFYGMNQASSLSVPSPGVLANDSDPDEDPLTVELVTGPANADSFQLNPDGSFSYTPPPYFYGEDSFTYRANDSTVSSEVATVHITVSQPGSQGFITGGGKFFQDGRKCTFGFVAKVVQGNGVQGNLEFQDHDMGIDVKSESVEWLYAPNQVDGSFSGTCRVNGVDGYSFFVQVHDQGQPGSNDDMTIWVFDSSNNLVYSAGGLLTGGNIVIHGN
jgi:Concanavalin A-like lectin/glucanases superfamily/Bacterial Ig domain